MEVSVKRAWATRNKRLIDGFSSVITPYSKQSKLPADGTYLNFTTQGNVEAVRLDFNFPGGLFSVNTGNGDIQNNSAALEADYRAAGSKSAWTPFSASAPRDVTARAQPITKIGVVNVPGALYDGMDHQFDNSRSSRRSQHHDQRRPGVDTARAAVTAKYGSYVGHR